ncbi:MAG TPA: hypothetical protein VF981_13400 [Gemmatimonadaceae bacterium]
MRLVFMVALSVAIGMSACTDDNPLAPKSLAGTYPLLQVNSVDPGVYNPVGAVTCAAAFQTGSLRINANGSFQFDVAYYYLCDPAGASDGPGIITVAGDDSRIVGEVLYLEGCGPALGQPTQCPPWTLQIQRALPNLTVEFLSTAASFWGDPVFTMGPRGE